MHGRLFDDVVCVSWVRLLGWPRSLGHRAREHTTCAVVMTVIHGANASVWMLGVSSIHTLFRCLWGLRAPKVLCLPGCYEPRVLLGWGGGLRQLMLRLCAQFVSRRRRTGMSMELFGVLQTVRRSCVGCVLRYQYATGATHLAPGWARLGWCPWWCPWWVQLAHGHCLVSTRTRAQRASL